MAIYYPPDEESIKKFLEDVKTIAMIGASPNPEKPSHDVMQYLLAEGFDVIPVRPDGKPVHGRASAKSLDEIEQKIDVVDVFRKAEALGPIVDKVIELDLPAIWIQLGIVNEEAAAKAQEAGLFTVMDRCIKQEHNKLGKPGPRGEQP